jgi:3',5'-cyclic AMP phosphodiesterase CpdA
MIVAQISDLHVQGSKGATRNKSFDEAIALETCVAQLNAGPYPIDLVIATGDLVQRGRTREYEPLKEILNGLKAPYFLLPGNHDARDALRATFSEANYFADETFLQFELTEFPVRVLGLDTLKVGEHGGQLCPARLAWIEARLREQRDRSTLIAMHHPPFPSGLPHFDKLGFDGGEAFAHIISQAPQVERLICGHIHRPISVKFAGTTGTVAPASCYTYEFALEDPQAFVATREPPGFQVHVWTEETLLTHTVPIGDFFERQLQFAAKS